MTAAQAVFRAPLQKQLCIYLTVVCIYSVYNRSVLQSMRSTRRTQELKLTVFTPDQLDSTVIRRET